MNFFCNQDLYRERLQIACSWWTSTRIQSSTLFGMSTLYNTIKLTCSNALFNIDLVAVRRGERTPSYSRKSRSTPAEYNFYTPDYSTLCYAQKKIQLFFFCLLYPKKTYIIWFFRLWNKVEQYVLRKNKLSPYVKAS